MYAPYPRRSRTSAGYQRRANSHRYRQHGPAPALPFPSPQSQLLSCITPQGELTHPGWMSAGEVKSSMLKLGLFGSANHYTVKPRLKHLQENECFFILYKHHWVSIVCKSSKLIFFDPAGKPYDMYFDGVYPQIYDLGVQVQDPDSVLCANFCLFFAYAVTKKMPPCSKYDIATNAYLYLNTFLYYSPSPLGANCMAMTLFTFFHKLGEEFDGDKVRYPKFSALRQLLNE
uniref:LO8 n=1 Tax=Blueface angelfish adomavirus TaxID=2609871 RepID=A0A6F9EY50_9VIRU|nr:TPA_asm: LO8 [Blueface angelfish adomavirus]